MFDTEMVNETITDARGFSSAVTEYFSLFTLKELNALPFMEKASDIFDLCDMYQEICEMSPLTAYFALARCHYLADELETEMSVIEQAITAKEQRGVTTQLDAGKIIKYWKDTSKDKYPVDFKKLRDTLSPETVVSVIGELRRSIDYDNMPEDMQTVAKALLDDLLTEPQEMQILAVRGILCISVED